MTTIEFSYSINQFSQALKSFAFKLTRDRDDAQDLLQETMLKAVCNKDKFTSGTNLRAWLYTIMKNTFITNYQRLIRRNTFIDTSEDLHFINSKESRTENLGYSHFTLNDIYKAIDNLDEVYKTPFTMYYNGFKYHEIADHLSIPIGTVKNRIHIARKLLKDFLKVYDSTN